MKKIQILAVVALLMMFGCSKDNLIDAEQDSIIVEDNNQLINSDRGPIKDNWGVGTGLWLRGSSDLGGSYEFLNWSENDVYLGVPVLKILTEGNFSGKLIGYGKINEILSNYTITIESVESNEDFGNEDNCSGQYFYNLKIIGSIYLSDKNSSYFTFTLMGKFYTNYSTYSLTYIGKNIPNSLTGNITYGDGKFLNFEKPINGIVWCDNLETGIISLRIY